jgi:hypothetical protein
MDSRVRSERFEPPMSFLRAPASIDRDFALDQDVGPDEADLPPDNISEEEPRGLRPVRAVALWLSMAVLGVPPTSRADVPAGTGHRHYVQ